MWCDNCLLIFPLRGGALAWGVFVALYSIVGGVFLLKWGQFLYFVYPEWYIYGGISMAVGALACVNVIALSNRSWIWGRVCMFLWPIVLIIAAIRGIIMIVELLRGKDEIEWECQNGGQLWGSSTVDSLGNGSSMPEAICGPGFTSLMTAFIISILIDLGCQLYMWFLNWRFVKRLEHYQTMKGPMMGGMYQA